MVSAPFCVDLSARRKNRMDNIYPVCIALKSWEEAKMGKDKKNKNNNVFLLPKDFLKTRLAMNIRAPQSKSRKTLYST